MPAAWFHDFKVFCVDFDGKYPILIEIITLSLDNNICRKLSATNVQMGF